MYDTSKCLVWRSKRGYKKVSSNLYNLSKKYPNYGEKFGVDFEMYHLLYCKNSTNEIHSDAVIGVLKMLSELGFLILTSTDCCITSKGWEKVSEMEKTESKANR